VRPLTLPDNDVLLASVAIIAQGGAGAASSLASYEPRGKKKTAPNPVTRAVKKGRPVDTEGADIAEVSCSQPHKQAARARNIFGVTTLSTFRRNVSASSPGLQRKPSKWPAITVYLAY
jgi:hypothetical protein